MKALALEWQVSGHSNYRTVNGEKETIIGRHPVCDIVLGDMYVSRRHAAVIYRNGRLLLHVLSTTNPVVINNGIVGDMGWVAALLPGDTFRVGQVEFHVAQPQPSEASAERPGSQPGKCPSCGSELDGVLPECPQCGTALDTEDTLAQTSLRAKTT